MGEREHHVLCFFLAEVPKHARCPSVANKTFYYYHHGGRMVFLGDRQAVKSSSEIATLFRVI
jgi:hypothetical protein